MSNTQEGMANDQEEADRYSGVRTQASRLCGGGVSRFSVESGRHKKPLLIVISAPSGGGKTTLCTKLLSEFSDIEYSISCTTRLKRGNEQDGRDYHFVSEAEFDKLIEKGRFLEYAIVHGYRYGTLKTTVLQSLSDGRSVLLDIDVQGARQIRKNVKYDPSLQKAMVDIFVTVENTKVLRDRLSRRDEDSAEAVELRLRNAVEELKSKDEFSYVVVNDRLELAYRRLVSILCKNWYDTENEVG